MEKIRILLLAIIPFVYSCSVHNSSDYPENDKIPIDTLQVITDYIDNSLDTIIKCPVKIVEYKISENTMKGEYSGFDYDYDVKIIVALDTTIFNKEMKRAMVDLRLDEGKFDSLVLNRIELFTDSIIGWSGNKYDAYYHTSLKEYYERTYDVGDKFDFEGQEAYVSECDISGDYIRIFLQKVITLEQLKRLLDDERMPYRSNIYVCTSHYEDDYTITGSVLIDAVHKKVYNVEHERHNYIFTFAYKLDD